MKVGFLGSGKMAQALMEGIRGKSVELYACDRNAEVIEKARLLGAKAAASASELANACDIIFIAVKPKAVLEALAEVGHGGRGKLFVSVAAGIETHAIERALPGSRILRLMPNIPFAIKRGAGAICAGKSASSADVASLKKLLGKSGHVVELKDEKLMHAVTALSGSGPAYFYMFISELAKGAMEQGMPEKDALELAAKTAEGAAGIFLESLKYGLTAEGLIAQVATPGGTTEAGLNEMRARKVDEALRAAVKKAAERSRELSK